MEQGQRAARGPDHGDAREGLGRAVRDAGNRIPRRIPDIRCRAACQRSRLQPSWRLVGAELVRPLLLCGGVRQPIFVVLAFATGCSTFAEHQAALVPTRRRYRRTGSRSARKASSAWARATHDLGRPTAGVPNVGDSVPSTQLRGSLESPRQPQRLDRRRHGEDRPRGGQSAGHFDLKPRVDNGPVAGGGPHITLVHPDRSLMDSASRSPPSILMWRCRSSEYSTCVMNCNVPGFTFDTQGSDQVLDASRSV